MFAEFFSSILLISSALIAAVFYRHCSVANKGIRDLGKLKVGPFSRIFVTNWKRRSNVFQPKIKIHFRRNKVVTYITGSCIGMRPTTSYRRQRAR